MSNPIVDYDNNNQPKNNLVVPRINVAPAQQVVASSPAVPPAGEFGVASPETTDTIEQGLVEGVEAVQPEEEPAVTDTTGMGIPDEVVNNTPTTFQQQEPQDYSNFQTPNDIASQYGLSAQDELLRSGQTANQLFNQTDLINNYLPTVYNPSPSIADKMSVEWDVERKKLNALAAKSESQKAAEIMQPMPQTRGSGGDKLAPNQVQPIGQKGTGVQQDIGWDTNDDSKVEWWEYGGAAVRATFNNPFAQSVLKSVAPALDALDRPRNIVQGVGYAYSSAVKDHVKKHGAAALYTLPDVKTGQQFITTVGDAVTGRKNFSFSGYESENPLGLREGKDPGVVKGEFLKDKDWWTGFAADTATDPLTYASFGVVPLLKVAQKGGLIGRAARVGATVLQFADDPISTVVGSGVSAGKKVIKLGSKKVETTTKQVVKDVPTPKTKTTTELPQVISRNPVPETPGRTFYSSPDGTVSTTKPERRTNQTQTLPTKEFVVYPNGGVKAVGEDDITKRFSEKVTWKTSREHIEFFATGKVPQAPRIPGELTQPRTELVVPEKPVVIEAGGATTPLEPVRVSVPDSQGSTVSIPKTFTKETQEVIDVYASQPEKRIEAKTVRRPKATTKSATIETTRTASTEVKPTSSTESTARSAARVDEPVKTTPTNWREQRLAEEQQALKAAQEGTTPNVLDETTNDVPKVEEPEEYQFFPEDEQIFQDVEQGKLIALDEHRVLEPQDAIVAKQAEVFNAQADAKLAELDIPDTDLDPYVNPEHNLKPEDQGLDNLDDKPELNTDLSRELVNSPYEKLTKFDDELKAVPKYTKEVEQNIISKTTAESTELYNKELKDLRTQYKTAGTLTKEVDAQLSSALAEKYKRRTNELTKERKQLVKENTGFGKALLDEVENAVDDEPYVNPEHNLKPEDQEVVPAAKQPKQENVPLNKEEILKKALAFKKQRETKEVWQARKAAVDARTAELEELKAKASAQPSSIPAISSRVFEGDMTVGEVAKVISENVPGSVFNPATLKPVVRTREQLTALMKLIPHPVTGLPLVEAGRTTFKTYAEIERRLRTLKIEEPVYFRIFAREGNAIPDEILTSPNLRIVNDKPKVFTPQPQVIIDNPNVKRVVEGMPTDFGGTAQRGLDDVQTLAGATDIKVENGVRSYKLQGFENVNKTTGKAVEDFRGKLIKERKALESKLLDIEDFDEYEKTLSRIGEIDEELTSPNLKDNKAHLEELQRTTIPDSQHGKSPEVVQATEKKIETELELNDLSNNVKALELEVKQQEELLEKTLQQVEQTADIGSFGIRQGAYKPSDTSFRNSGDVDTKAVKKIKDNLSFLIGDSQGYGKQVYRLFSDVAFSKQLDISELYALAKGAIEEVVPESEVAEKLLSSFNKSISSYLKKSGVDVKALDSIEAILPRTLSQDHITPTVASRPVVKQLPTSLGFVSETPLRSYIDTELFKPNVEKHLDGLFPKDVRSEFIPRTTESGVTLYTTKNVSDAFVAEVEKGIKTVVNVFPEVKGAPVVLLDEDSIRKLRPDIGDTEAKRRGQPRISSYSAQTGVVTIVNDGRNGISRTTVHELAHSITLGGKYGDISFDSYTTSDGHTAIQKRTWEELVKGENVPNAYAGRSVEEDLAESITYFLTDHRRFVKTHPKRAAVVESILRLKDDIRREYQGKPYYLGSRLINMDLGNAASTGEFGYGHYLTTVESHAVNEALSPVNENLSKFGYTFGEDAKVYQARAFVENVLEADSIANAPVLNAFKTVLDGFNDIDDDLGRKLLKIFNSATSKKPYTVKELYGLVERSVLKHVGTDELGKEFLSMFYESIPEGLKEVGYDAISDNHRMMVLDVNKVDVDILNPRIINSEGTPLDIATAQHNFDSVTAKNNPKSPTAQVKHMESTVKLQSEMLEATKKRLEDAKAEQQKLMDKMFRADDELKAKAKIEKAKETLRKEKKQRRENDAQNEKYGKPANKDGCNF